AKLVQGAIAAVVRRLLLLDDVSFDGDAEVIGLAGKVGAGVVVFVLFERWIAQVTPKHRRQAEFVGALKGFAGLDDLMVRFRRAVVNGRANGDRAHVPGLPDLSEVNLIEG